MNVTEPVPTWLVREAKRLQTITGFVTIHPNKGDPRTRAFSRYDHVTRVASLALSLGESRRASRSELLLLCWLHDINRWPFAHNAEQGRFDQAEDLERFIGGRLPPETVRQVVGVANKDVQSLGREARLVLLADIVTGLIEDTLFTITALNLSPSELPREALDLLRLPIGQDAFMEELQYLYTLLNSDTDVPGFTRNFNSLAFRCSVRFLSDHNFLEGAGLESNEFWRIRTVLREEYLERHVFPLNNELVCHGELIRNVAVDPVLARLGADAAGAMTRWTEVDLIAYVLRERVATEETVSALAPTLDYIQIFQPERSFCVTTS